MRKLFRLLTVAIFFVMTIFVMTGCSEINSDNFDKPKSVTAHYFQKGVYKSYYLDKKNSYNYFYVFYDENSGHTEDSERGIGLPFSCVQSDGYVKFKFGGAEEPDETLKIKSFKNGVITGSFEDDLMLIFIPIPNANRIIDTSKRVGYNRHVL